MSKDEKDLSLFTILPMIQSIVLNCWHSEHLPYTKSQLILFSVLLSRESATMKEIASLLSCSKEQATRVVAPLVDAGLVDRYVDPSNRNFIHIRMTETGNRKILEHREHFHQNLDSLLSDKLSQEEQTTLFQSLYTAIDLLQKVQ